MSALKQLLKANGWMVVVAALAFAVAFRFVDPAPPDSLTVATGADGGRYHQVALQLEERLARDGLKLNLVPSAGSIANLEMLAAEEGEVSLAFVQSGVENLYGGDTSKLRGLGALYYEPLWIFYHRDQPIELVTELEDKRVAVGAPGSGTRAVANLLLEASGLSAEGALANISASEIGGDDAASALETSQVDAAFFVQSADSPLIKRLALNPALDFLDIRRAEAYERHYPFVSSCSIPEGLLDLGADVPSTDRTVLAPAATLVVNDRFHPALTPVLLEAARSVVGEGGVLEPAGEFPTARFSSFPLTPEADHYYRKGPPFLMRYMPFWAASLVDRLVILLVPFMMVLVPLARFAGPIYQWRTRSKIYRWYRHLQETDAKIRDGSIRRDTTAEIERLRQLQVEISQVEVPLSYMDQLYDLQLHVGHVLGRLRALQIGSGKDEDQAAT